MKRLAILLVLACAATLYAAGSTVEQVHDAGALLTDDSIPPRRLVIMDSDGTLSLAAATSDNVIGVVDTAEKTIVFGFEAGGWSDFSTGLHVYLLPSARQPLVDVATGDTIDPGDIVFQANDGKVASTGTVRFGVSITAGNDTTPVRVVTR